MVFLFKLLDAFSKNTNKLANDRIKTGEMTDFNAKNLSKIKTDEELNEYIKKLSIKPQYTQKLQSELKSDPVNLKRFINHYGDEVEELINRNGYPPKYWKARPKYGNTQVDDTWKNAKLDEDNIFLKKME